MAERIFQSQLSKKLNSMHVTVHYSICNTASGQCSLDSNTVVFFLVGSFLNLNNLNVFNALLLTV